MNELAQVLKELKKANQNLLFSRVAQHLSGRNVHVHFRKPALKGVRGLAFRRGNQAVIHVSPELDDDELLKVFLHEVAHVLKHYPILSTSPDLDADPETLVWTSRKAQHDEVYQAQLKEDEVKAQVKQWLALAPGGRLEERLNALLKV